MSGLKYQSAGYHSVVNGQKTYNGVALLSKQPPADLSCDIPGFADEQKRVEILKRLTQIYRDRQPDPTRAIELYNEILAIKPEDVQTKRALTALYDRAGNFAEVLNILREQYDRSKSNTERVQLLRRMAELWHDEESVRDETSAAWACEQILSYVPKDATAHHRLQLIHQEAAN